MFFIQSDLLLRQYILCFITVFIAPISIIHSRRVVFVSSVNIVRGLVWRNQRERSDNALMRTLLSLLGCAKTSWGKGRRSFFLNPWNQRWLAGKPDVSKDVSTLQWLFVILLVKICHLHISDNDMFMPRVLIQVSHIVTKWIKLTHIQKF